MKTVVVYESMFGNTRVVAAAIAEGLERVGHVVILPVGEVTPDVLTGVDLLVVGGPTHVHGMTRPSSRKAAGEMARKLGSTIALEPGAEGNGLREWLAGKPELVTRVAAFDTRMHGPGIFTGRASRGIQRMLRRCGGRAVAVPQSFFVTKTNVLDPGERERAVRWGAALGSLMADRTSVPA